MSIATAHSDDGRYVINYGHNPISGVFFDVSDTKSPDEDFIITFCALLGKTLCPDFADKYAFSLGFLEVLVPWEKGYKFLVEASDLVAIASFFGIALNQSKVTQVLEAV